MNTIRDLRSFLILIFVFICAYTLLGVEMFAYKMKFNEQD